MIQYSPLAGSSYINLPKEIDLPQTGLIDIHNIDDNECFKQSLVRCLYPSDHHPAIIIKAETDFTKQLAFKDIKFPVKMRNIH